MASSSWWISAVWVSLTLLVALAAEGSSVRSWMLVMVVGVIPPAVLLRLWSDGPSPTIAEVLHATERKR
jgi:hypothetical protein